MMREASWNAFRPLNGRAGSKQKDLFVFLLMTILSQSFFAFVRSNFMSFPFSPTRHKQYVLKANVIEMF